MTIEIHPNEFLLSRFINWIIKGPSSRRYHPADLRLPDYKTETVRKKISQELSRARSHMERQKSRSWFHSSFSNLSRAPCPYDIQSETILGGKVSVAHAQGMRSTMEDVHVVGAGTIGKTSYELFGIIDGHGGVEVAQFVGTHIQEEIEKALRKHGLSHSGIQKALKEAFVQLDARIPLSIANASGAAAVISLKIGSQLLTANLGDSRAVLKAGNRVIQLSEDAKPDTPRFRKTIEKRGGWVETVDVPRINGVLACGRAFGDKHLRGEKGHYVVSPRPKITKVDLNAYKSPLYLILACDGIWDVASSKEAASVVVSGSIEEDAAALVRGAMNGGSTDNCSALLVSFA